MLVDIILSNLIHNESFSRRVLPYIEPEYFDNSAHKKIFDSIHNYTSEYKEPPSIETLKILIENRKDLDDKTFSDIKETFRVLKSNPDVNEDWLVIETEKYCQAQAFSNALRKCIKIYEGESKDEDMGAAPQIMSDALAVSFDSSIGHDFFGDIEDRFAFYHQVDQRIPYDIDMFNKVTKGGLPRKSLVVYMAETGAGKSLVMCHQAAAAMMHGYNVLYITMELAEERVSERIDANILDISLDDLKKMDSETYVRRMTKLRKNTRGNLYVKEYPTGSAHAGHFRHLLNELKLKKKFVPDIVFIDYLNICASFRIKGANAANSYTLVKSIAEEIRGIAMEFDIPIVSATQSNRSGYNNTDVDITNTSESMGLPHTVDALFALMTSEQLQEAGQLMVKQLKNRWGDVSYYRKFVVGIDRSKMKLYDLSDSAQDSIMPDATLKDDKKSKDWESSLDKTKNPDKKELFIFEED